MGSVAPVVGLRGETKGMGRKWRVVATSELLIDVPVASHARRSVELEGLHSLEWSPVKRRKEEAYS